MPNPNPTNLTMHFTLPRLCLSLWICLLAWGKAHSQNILPITQENADASQLKEMLNTSNKELKKIRTQKQKAEIKIIAKSLRADVELDLEEDLNKQVVVVRTAPAPTTITPRGAPAVAPPPTNTTPRSVNAPAVEETKPQANTPIEPTPRPTPTANSNPNLRIIQKDLLLAKKEMQLLKEQEAKKQVEIAALVKTLEVKNLRQQNIITIGAIGLALTFVVAILLYRNVNAQKKANQLLAQQKQATEKAKNQAEQLLLNILPAPVAQELKTQGKAKAQYYELASVMFTDFKGFTTIAETMTPTQLLESLEECFNAFDEIISKYNLEKIKTIGDAYMCAGGLPTPNKTNPVECVLAGFEIQQFMKQKYQEKAAEGTQYWQLRLGINSGELIAGVIGTKKFAYDVWGDTVNTASRMESSGDVNKVNISGATYNLVKDFFECEYRGKLDVKGKGQVDMYFVNQIKPELSEQGLGLVPNTAFWQLLAQKTA